MPKFEKGNPGKPPGAKNRSTIIMRDQIQNLFNTNFETIQDDLESLEPKDRLKFMTDLMPYLMPKLQSTTYSSEIDLDGMTGEQLDVLIKRIVND